MDVCCLNRPFDDQEQDRVHLEAEAVLLILKHCESGKWQWFSSAVVSQEVDNIPNCDRKNRIKELLKEASKFIPLSSTAVERGEELKEIGLKTYDALHVACAEQAQVDVLLTTDDRLLRVAIRSAHKLKVRIENPLMWLQKVL